MPFFGDDAGPFEQSQPVSQDIGSYFFFRRYEFSISAFAAHGNITHYEQRPFITNNIQRRTDRAVGTFFYFLHHTKIIFYLHFKSKMIYFDLHFESKNLNQQL